MAEPALVPPLVLCVLLGYGAYRDVKTREIPDGLWVVMGVVAVVFRGVDHQWKMMGVSVGVCAGIVAVLALSGLFGGADIKALLAVSLLVPTYEGMVFPIFVVSVFNNLAFIKIGELFAVFFYNVVKKNTYKGIPLWKKAVLFMTGFPMPKERVDFRFLPLQDTEGNLRLIPDIDADVEAFKHEYRGENVWVTYGSPFILYILVASVIALTKGDILFRLLFL